MNKWSLTENIKLLLFGFLTIAALYFGAPFFIPVAIAGIFSMLFLPLSRRLEQRLKRWIAVLICIFILLSVVSGLATLLSWQFSSMGDDIPKMQERIKSLADQVKGYLSGVLGISQEQVESGQQQATENAGKILTVVFGSLMSVLVNFILVVVYIFLFLYFRTHIKKFILMLVPQNNKKETERVMYETAQVAQKYVTGLGTMIVMLWIMYGIGFSIVGVKGALLFAILCGLLEIVPFIGNITGTSLTVLAVISQGGSGGIIIGVIITYFLVQFIQTYFLEPLIVGSGVNINPLSTIMVLIVGELIWGIPGLILAIPLLAMVKIICDHVEPLKPYGFLIGETKKPGKQRSFVERFRKRKK